MRFISEKLNPRGPFDERIIENSTCDDVSPESFLQLFEVLDNEPIRNLKNDRAPDKILELLNAGEYNENGEFNLNNTGALFFARDIEKFNIDHEVKMVRFEGNDRLGIIDRLDSKNSFLILLKEFEEFLQKNTKHGAIVRGMKRISIPEYPYEAVREAFINAIAHRDYEMEGSFITFYIYDDRIEITSPGNLPYPLTIKDLGKTENPAHRNKTICNLFSKTMYMEHVGTGIRRMEEAMVKNGLPKPEFYNDNNFFKVILRGPNGKLIYDEDDVNENILDLNEIGLNERQITALKKMVNANKSYTYKTYGKEFEVSKSTAIRDLNKLIKYELIIKTKDQYPVLFIGK